jgi:1-deoxy-D-xylulose-5-phosphate reductoisomerase
MAAIRQKKEIALANKETLVAGGEIVMTAAKENGVTIYPIDSEHSAIFQCLQGNQDNDIEKLYLTASGGPFRGKTAEELETVTPKQALKHPNWSMGAKITIDSATMMNKGFEVIEAHWLFGVPVERIQVLVHPQSVIHSMVGFADGAVMAQLGAPDMRVPIQYALTHPKRLENHFPRINFLENSNLTFEAPNLALFPCLGMAFDAIKAGGALPAVMNAANEIAVARFLCGEIRFLEIACIIEKTMRAYTVKSENTLEEIFAADTWARSFAAALLR